MALKILFFILIYSWLCIPSLLLAVPIFEHPLLIKNVVQPAPPFLRKEKLIEDTKALYQLLSQVYSRYDSLSQQGVAWESIFQGLIQKYQQLNQPLLTQQFLQDLLEALAVTEDPTLEARMYLNKREYTKFVFPKSTPFYSQLYLSLANQKFKVLPGKISPDIVNSWFQGCTSHRYQLLNALPGRIGEKRFVLGVLNTEFLPSIVCNFEITVGNQRSFVLPMHQTVEFSFPSLPTDTVFQYTNQPIPYLQWFQDGKRYERETRELYNIALELQGYSVMIIDVRGNLEGSFNYLNQWFAKVTNAQWETGFLHERHSPAVLYGLLNQLEYQLKMADTFTKRNEISQKKKQVRDLLRRLRLYAGEANTVKTKFIFSGDEFAAVWKKKLIVLANHQCGEGCQFLASLAKQLPHSYLIGESTGSYPHQPLLPLFQLPHSKINLTLNHYLQLDINNATIPAIGHTPDYWFDPQDSIEKVFRFARSLLQQVPIETNSSSQFN